MPIYEYECVSCKLVIEQVVSIKDNVREIKCTSCNNVAKKVVSNSTFFLEGRGWAKDGYVSKSDKFKAAMSDI